MIANVSPSIQTFEDTRNTLAYANRAKNIKTNVQRNVVNVQYHISNYDQIIKNLKTEIQELKSQLAKKDYSLNNIVPSKAQEPKKEDLKESMTKPIANTNNAVNNSYFEKAVSELKAHCEEELVLKQKIIDQEQEMNSLNALINKKKIDFINNSANNIFNSININTDPNNPLYNLNNNNKDLNINLNDDITNLNLEEKEILINPNINNSIVSNIPAINANLSNNELVLSNQQKELEGKLALQKKNWEKNLEKFKEMQKKREQMVSTYNKNGIKDFHFEYLQSIIKAHNLKIFIIENRFKDKFNYVVSEVKENYISVLEGQLKIRDDLIKKQNVSLPSDDTERLKSLDQIKNEFSYKLPLILNHKILNKDTNASLDLNFSSLSSTNLPPINRNNPNINNILSEIRSVNANISRIENDPRMIRDNNYNNYNNAQNAISYKNRLKNEYTANLNKLEGQGNKFKYARNYSQGVRNLNMAMIGSSNINNSGGNINNSNNNLSSNILNNYRLNQIEQSSPININVNSSIDNYSKQQQLLSLNQRIQQNKLLALGNKNSKKHKNFNLNLINQKRRDSQSEKSDSNNLSRDYDSYMLDLDNSKDDSQIKKLKQKLRDRKSAQPKSYNLRDDLISNYSPNYSPIRKEGQKGGIPSQMRKEYDSIPVVKKKDLNVFLVERNKNKNLKKNVFKI